MNPHSLLNPPSLLPHDTKISWGNLTETAQALAMACFSKNSKKCSVIITADAHEAARLRRELTFFQSDTDTPILYFPDWEILPFDHFSPHEDIISDRLKTLHQASRLTQGIILIALPTLLHRLLPKDYLETHVFLLKQGDTIDLESLTKQLVMSGYRRVEMVREHGEFSIRGSIWDIYPAGSGQPFRVELFDTQIDTIRTFDPDTQLSHEPCHSIELLPAREYPLTEQAITRFRQNFRDHFSGNPRECSLYEAISSGSPFPGSEYYLPLFYDALDTFFNYIPKNAVLFMPDTIHEKMEHYWIELEKRYDQLSHDIKRPICELPELFIRPDELFGLMKNHPHIRLSNLKLADKAGHMNFAGSALPDLHIERKAKQPLEKLKHFMDHYQGAVLLTAESTGRRETLLDLLRSIHLYPHPIPSWHDFIQESSANKEHKVWMTIAPLDHGLLLNTPAVCLIPEAALFGEQVMQRRLRHKQQTHAADMIQSFSELRIGSPVVHIEHGIGRYKGLEVITTSNIAAEYLTLEYADNARIYVPIGSLHLINRYTGIDADHVQLTKLGSNRWSKTKASAIQQIHDVATELLKLYSEREATPGYAFPTPSEDYIKFRTDFPFEETPDQTTAIDNVIHDMTKSCSMDRLVCGDVGFGKTEVAMQAAFHAANSGKQVALLAPTTLLAEQHYHNFKDRFADWPIQIGVLSRLQNRKSQDEALQKLKKGSIDIIIGTHKLLQEGIEFKDLGLLIVDEEHRFGVRQKEKIKSLRAFVDILSLTATPIPRTLNMALSGTRDLSLISTPPLKRLSIKTFLHNYSHAIIYEALSREIRRGGQAYFLHNDVATIAATAEEIRAILPEAQVGIAHGQMRERELERVMSDFYHQRFNVLVCTTIIESGIDIPSANTIIIDRADKLGLAQLHQIRGRVGRSHHQAYAYLLVPDKKTLTADAQKRLDAITSFEDLGAGFMLARQDLEIRGAGELLGEEQSGHMEAIGFALYMELLEEAVTALKEGRKANLDLDSRQHNIDIDFHVTTLLPNDYVSDIGMRLTLYKRLSQCNTLEDIEQFKSELIDRFGLLPLPAEYLIRAAQLKLPAKKIGIIKIDLQKDYGYLHFNSNPNVNMQRLIMLIQKYPHTYQLQGKDKLRITYHSNSITDKIEMTENLILDIT